MAFSHSFYDLETAGASADVIGPGAGLTPADLASASARVEQALRALMDAREAGEAGFLDLPFRSDLAGPCIELADSLRGRCETLVVLGMGGSALGARALVSALAHPMHSLLPAAARGGRPRILVLDTADPAALVPVLDGLPPESTWWNVVSKSGGTLETVAAYAALRPRLESRLGRAWRDHVILTTDPVAGPMREEAERERLPSLIVPPDVGGRFSVLSHCGLFPAAAAGVDIAGLLRGAAAASADLGDVDPARNDALRLALWLVLLAERRGRRHHVFLPYRYGMTDLAAWWQQAWAESLGKDGRGFDATPAVGSGSQHSLLQLWMDGPADKAFIVLEVDDPGTDAVLGPPPPPGAPWLLRRTLGDAHRALAGGTRAALAQHGRPVIGIRLPVVNPETVGALLQLLLAATALAGPLSGVHPFGQPGVEAGKKAAKSLLGGDGDDRAARTRVEALLETLRRRP